MSWENFIFAWNFTWLKNCYLEMSFTVSLYVPNKSLRMVILGLFVYFHIIYRVRLLIYIKIIRICHMLTWYYF